MRDISLVLLSLRSRWLSNFLSLFLVAFGFMLLLLLFIGEHHIRNRLVSDGGGVDLVIGAKGSPLQLILSSLYHLDIPSGNIPYDEAKKWISNPQVEVAVPLALGDQWKGFRIVGTSHDYLDLYRAKVLEGRLWSKSYEAVAGANTRLKVGDRFHGAHGLSEGGHVHEGETYLVTGVLAPSGSVLDRLILTSVESVMDIHGQHIEEDKEEHHSEGHEHEEGHHEEGGYEEHNAEVTALLVKAKGPIAQRNLPYQINRESRFLAASPAYEIARLVGVLGFGSKMFAGFSALVLFFSGVSIFSGLGGSFLSRAGDMAVLRSLGYSRIRLAALLLTEAAIITGMGLIIGTVLCFFGLSWLLSVSPALAESGVAFDLSAPGLIYAYVFIYLAGLCSAIIPAWKAASLDVSGQLSRI